MAALRAQGVDRPDRAVAENQPSRRFISAAQCPKANATSGIGFSESKELLRGPKKSRLVFSIANRADGGIRGLQMDEL
jgi:hypothetical protein